MDQRTRRNSTKLYRILNTIYLQRHLLSIRNAFIGVMPIMIIGAFATLINQLPFSGYQAFMRDTFGENWLLFGQLVYTATIQITAIYISFAIGNNLATWYNNHGKNKVHPMICGVVSLSSYIIMCIPLNITDSLPISILNVSGIFLATIVSLIISELFITLTKRRANRVVTDDPNEAVSLSIPSILPTIIILTVATAIRLVLLKSGDANGLNIFINRAFYNLIASGSNSIGTLYKFVLSAHIMWLFGIHGGDVLYQVSQNAFSPAIIDNITAFSNGLPAPHLVTKTMYDVYVFMGGAGMTLSLILALLFFGRHNYNSLYRYTLPTALFNINEPLIFGLPIVLNPVYAIPFVVAPMITIGTTILSMKWGLVPYTIADVPWSTPVFISGYLATRSFSGVVLQAVNLLIGIAVYAPFVRLSQNVTKFRFEEVYRELCRLSENDYVVANRMIIQRNDDIGNVGRSLAMRLQSAIKTKEMFVVYQPIIDIQNNRIASVEALLRWKHPVYGMINPMLTVVLAEETNLIEQLGLWVLEQSVAQRAKWTEEGLPDFYLSVNASTKQLENRAFYKDVESIIKRYNVPPHQLQIEITEAVGLSNDAATHTNLDGFKSIGISLAMDDFGAGHSSLLYISSQPITTLKVDRCLSRDILTSQTNRDIITLIDTLAKHLSLKTVVEYVETKEQLEALREIGITLIQGYYFSPPVSPMEIASFISKIEHEQRP